MSNLSVLDLVEMIRQQLEGVQRHAICPEFQVLIALRFYAEGGYQKGIGQDCFHPVSQPTVSKILKKVTNALCRLAERYIQFPKTCEDRTEVSNKFVYIS